MNSRQRVVTALKHQEPDRVPYDLGATTVTGINVVAYHKLRAYLGLPSVDAQLVDISEQIAWVDEDVLERLGADVRSVSPRSSATFQIQVREQADYTYFYDEWHIGRKMPNDGGIYYDMFEHPLRGDIGKNDIDRFPWPDPLHPARFEGMAAAARQIAEVEGRAVIMGNLTAGILETYAWLRGFEDYFADLAANHALAEHLLHKILELKLAYWEQALELVGPYLDVAHEADDMAGQQSLLLSPRTYRKLVKPLHKELFDLIHRKSQAKVLFHSCGAIRPLICDLIEIGVEILNPVQVSAAGMESAELKREFGRELSFWGGGVDTQRVLGTGTPQEVREETKRRLQDLMPGGGFVFNTVHNIQRNVPPENIMAMWETLQQYGIYR